MDCDYSPKCNFPKKKKNLLFDLLYIYESLSFTSHTTVVSNFTKPSVSVLYIIAWESCYGNDVHSSRMDYLTANISVLSHRRDYITLIACICRGCRIVSVKAVNCLVSRLSGIWYTVTHTVVHSGS